MKTRWHPNKFGIYVPTRGGRGDDGFISPALLGAIAGARRRSYVAYTAVWDGSTTASNRDTGITGMTNQKTLTCSFWLNSTGKNGTAVQYYGSTDGFGSIRCQVAKTTANQIQVFAKNTGGTTILNIHGSTAITTTSGWNHIFIAIDLAAATKHLLIYVNGVAETVTETTYSDDTMHLNCAFGTNRYALATLTTQARLSEFWFSPTYLGSPSSFSSGGFPASIGPHGVVSGTTPVFYFSRSGGGNTWGTDSSGNGNNITITNATSGTLP